MNIGMGLIVFLISLIALVAEFILYFIFGFGASFSGNISTLEGVAFFFVGLMVLTGAIGFLYPLFAIIATVTKRKSLCIRLFIIILGIIFIGYFFIFPTLIKKVKSTTVLKQDKLEKIVSTQKTKEANSEKLEKPLLIPTLTNKRIQESDWGRGIYEDAIWFDVSWDTSHLKKPTRAIKGTLVISDIFGEPKLRLRWTINQPLTPGTSYTEKGVGFEYNQFKDSSKWVRATDLKDMTFRFEVTDIIYQDETKETF